MRALNLLRHPSLAREQKVFHRWWTSLAGLLVGTSLAWGWQQWLGWETARLRQAQNHLQEALRTRQQQANEAVKQQSQVRRHAEQMAQIKQIAEHQQVWLRLHEGLEQEARNRGLRLVRLQSEAEQIELHGTMSRPDVMAQVRQSLSAQWPQPLVLTSMALGPAEEVHFVWQARWPQAPGVVSPPVRTQGAKP